MGDILEQLQEQMSELQNQIAGLARDLRLERAILIAFMAQHGDPTHISVKRLAELRGCSRSTIQRDVDRGIYTLETDSRTGKKGIPIQQVYANWTPIGAVKTAIEREAAAAGGTLKKPRHGSSR